MKYPSNSLWIIPESSRRHSGVIKTQMVDLKLFSYWEFELAFIGRRLLEIISSTSKKSVALIFI